MKTEPKEDTDLLGINKNNVLNIGTDTTTKRIEDYQGPPDGGFRAYLIVLGSFLTNGLLFGVINSYSVIYTVLQKRLEIENVPNSESKACKLMILILLLVTLATIKLNEKLRILVKI